MIMHSLRDDTYVVRRIDIDKPRFMLGFTPLEEGKDKCISEVYDHLCYDVMKKVIDSSLRG